MQRGFLGGLLGAAAGIAMASGAQAADMPVKAKPVEYVKICSAYGAGFYYIPGTDICLRVGGYVRADYYHNAGGAFPYLTGRTRARENHTFRGRGAWILDARNNTAYGTLRAYLNGYFAADTTNAAASLVTGSSGASLGEYTSYAADKAFIQWAGFTFGRSNSFYDFFAGPGPHSNLVSYNAPGTGATGWNVLAYTAQFGNGLSATLSLEDQRRRPIVDTAPVFGTAPTTNGIRAGQQAPAVVGALRVDQAWGSAQVMAVWQELRTLETSSIDSSGYAFGGGFTLNNPSAPGSQFGIQANYAKGALGYVVTGTNGHNLVNGLGTHSSGFIADAVLIGTALHKTEGWNVHASYQHRFNPQWAASINAGYTEIDYNAAVNALGGCGTGCDFDFWSVGGRLNWTPVTGLNFGLDVIYHEFGSQGAGAGLVTPGDRDVWAAMFRAQRDF